MSDSLLQDRLARLESKLDALAKGLDAVETRLGALEASGGSTLAAAPPARLSPPVEGGSTPGLSLARILSLLGRSCLVLGGAFLVRAATEAGALPHEAGVVLGFLYALVWVALSDRAAAKGERASAEAHGLAAAVIAFPLLEEAVTRFGVSGPGGGAVGLALLTVLLLTLAVRRRLPVLGWTATLGLIFTAFALLKATLAIEPLAILLLGLFVATVWLEDRSGWPGLKWPAALAADLAILQLAFVVAQKGGPPEAYRGLSIPGALSLCLALPAASLIGLAVRNIAVRREVTPFVPLQTVIALVVGFGGAVRIAEVAGWGTGILGMGALLVGFLAYAPSFDPRTQRGDLKRALLLSDSLAFVLVVWGGTLLLQRDGRSLLFSAVGLLAGLASARLSRNALAVHAALYLTLAASASGLIALSLSAFTGAPDTIALSAAPAAFVALAAAAASFAALAAAGEETWPARLARLALAILSVAGLGGVCLLVLFGVVSSQPALVAVLRTAVLSAAAVALAVCRRSARLKELAWLTYPVLLMGGVKLLFEDLRVGRGSTLFLGFAVYGISLIAAPRLFSRPAASEAALDRGAAAVGPDHVKRAS